MRHRYDAQRYLRLGHEWMFFTLPTIALPCFCRFSSTFCKRKMFDGRADTNRVSTFYVGEFRTRVASVSTDRVPAAIYYVKQVCVFALRANGFIACASSCINKRGDKHISNIVHTWGGRWTHLFYKWNGIKCAGCSVSVQAAHSEGIWTRVEERPRIGRRVFKRFAWIVDQTALLILTFAQIPSFFARPFLF